MSERKITLTQEDNGKSLVVRPGDEIAIGLSENISGGYQWVVIDPDVQILPLLHTDEGKSPSDAPGAYSMKTFQFKAKSTGTRHVQLRHLRKWQGDVSTIEVFDVDVEVRGAES
jgi:predicted secreted protein